MNKHLKNETGMALITVLVVLTIFTVLGMGILSLSLNNFTTGRYELEDEAAYYIAEGGINAALIEIKKIEQEILDTVDFEEDTNEDIIRKITARLTTETGNFLTMTGVKEENRKRFTNEYGETSVVVELEPGTKEDEFILTSSSQIINDNRTLERVLRQVFYIGIEGSSPSDPGTDPDSGTDPGSGGGTGGGSSESSPSIPGNAAVFTGSTITLSGGSSITGNVGFKETGGSVSLNGGASINGKVYVPPGAETSGLNVPHYMTSPEVETYSGDMEFPMLIFPNAPVYQTAEPIEQQATNGNNKSYNVIENGMLNIKTQYNDSFTWSLTESTRLEEILLTSNTTLTIDTGNSDKVIVLDRLSLSQGHINVVGNGKLTIYVKDTMSFGGGSTFNENTQDANKLNLYLMDNGKNQTIQLNGSQKIYGSLFAEKANIDFGGGGGFQGNIYTGGSSIEFNGGVRAEASVIYAPQADAVLKGGAKIKGAIIAQTFSGQGGASVEYGNYNLDWLDFVSGGDKEADPGDGAGNPGGGSGNSGESTYIREGKTVEIPSS